ncbi:MAG: helix-turn-helix domain-containing protein [Lachnospiraceae bacterium]|nr:helix-turn-helix domain-containing protein [Lachnospiraceae bacterium]
MNLHKIYHPITATPFQCTQDYMEFAPCDALKPYIRCFWGSEKPFLQEESFIETIDIVTPDTCMDIIFTADFSKNVIVNSFCGIDDRTFLYPNRHREKKTFFRFAIRFYPWGVSMFAQESMKNTKNAFFDVDYHFSGIKNEIEKRLFDIENIRQLIPIAEAIFLNHFQEKHQNPVVFQAVSKILRARGNLAVTDLKQELLIGSRQLERLFLEYIGVSPKSLAALVRYQYLWNGILYDKDFHTADAAYQYGYSDQAHLCHDFKKYHSMNISDAKKYAMQNVGNIQYKSSEARYNGL